MKVFFAKTAMVLTTPSISNFFSDSHAGQFFRDLRPGREFTANIIDRLQHTLIQAFYHFGSLPRYS